ncbi:MAG: hypothetical protein HOV80_39455 [Polyangiaceae bacterium]|nr:hypothetical protein [Polyangiaceae bacterium]
MGIGALLTTILEGCCFSSVCNCPEDAHQTVTEDQPVGEAYLALIADGELSEDDCKQICEEYEEEYDYRRVIECSDLRPIVGSSTVTTGAGGGGGAGGGAEATQMQVTCVVEEPYYCEGRRHAEVVSGTGGRGPTYVAAWLSRAARAEAASILSFRALAGELRRLGAPDALVTAARAAAREEAGHARLVGHLAREAGGELPARAERRDGVPRSLIDVALENATVPSVRSAMETIAPEEVGHAELAWSIHRWAMERLHVGERVAVERAMHEALERLVAGAVEENAPAAARAALGLPDAAGAAALARGLRDGLALPAAA